MKKIKDKFTGMKISREAKRQLRRIAAGLCIRKCNRKIYKARLCKKHYLERQSKRKIN